jgi:lipopolysaccharide/colanic/teichoic acid biosynthesis glycosyltransferase
MRRATDVAASSLLLVLSAPLVGLFGLLVKVEDRGPMFFPHLRVGRDGRTFKCWKIRTMHVDTSDNLESSDRWADYVLSDFKIADSDHRVTRIGRFLRQRHLDELPQLWNVIRGDLSLVGPRPVIQEELAWWGPCSGELLSVRPGVFGAWQLTNHLPYPERAYLELAYVRKRTMSLDIEILARTALGLIGRRGRPVKELLPRARLNSASTEADLLPADERPSGRRVQSTHPNGTRRARIPPKTRPGMASVEPVKAQGHGAGDSVTS